MQQRFMDNARDGAARQYELHAPGADFRLRRGAFDRDRRGGWIALSISRGLARAGTLAQGWPAAT